MGQKFLFVLVGCIFAAIAGATFVNNNYIEWPLHEDPVLPDISPISNDFEPPKGYITPDSLNPSKDKTII